MNKKIIDNYAHDYRNMFMDKNALYEMLANFADEIMAEQKQEIKEKDEKIEELPDIGGYDSDVVEKVNEIIDLLNKRL